MARALEERVESGERSAAAWRMNGDWRMENGEGGATQAFF